MKRTRQLHSAMPPIEISERRKWEAVEAARLASRRDGKPRYVWFDDDACLWRIGDRKPNEGDYHRVWVGEVTDVEFCQPGEESTRIEPAPYGRNA
jgi:hypothetical protein